VKKGGWGVDNPSSRVARSMHHWQWSAERPGQSYPQVIPVELSTAYPQLIALLQ